MKILTGDCVSLMSTNIKDNTIDCILTSPPYDGVRQYKKGNGFDSQALGVEIERVLKPGCFAIVLIADQKKAKRLSLTTARIMIDWVDNAGLSLCDWLVYKRQGRIGRYHSFRRDHESLLVFFKGDKPNDINTGVLKKPVLNPGIGRKTNISMREADDSISKKEFVAKYDTMCRGSVWEYKGWGGAMQGKWHKYHPAMMRVELVRDCLLAFSKKGDLVLDPFSGSGTTGLACKLLGREYIGIDISAEYNAVAHRRIKEETAQTHLIEAP